MKAFNKPRVSLPHAVLLAFLLTTLLPAQSLDFGERDARPAPPWLSTASIYEIWLNTFTKEGNLRGAIARLPDVADLGATIVYLGPIAKRSADPSASPYTIADYNAIDPEAGTPQDLRDFVAAAHKLHLKVLLDIVYYHVAADSVWSEQQPSLLAHAADGSLVEGFWNQPMPDFTNHATTTALTNSLVGWVRNYGVDGFRCDVGGGVPLAFWVGVRHALDATKPGILLLSESDRPDDQLEAFDLNYNFAWYLSLRAVLRDGAPAIALRQRWEENRATMPHGARLLHFSDNHDWPRAVLQFGESGALAASVLNFTLNGVPMLWNGQEIADPSPTVWRRLAPISWPGPRALSDPDNPAVVTRGIYRQLFHLREDPAISTGSLTWIDNSEPDSVLSFLRQVPGETVLVLVNLSNRSLHVTVDLPVMDYYVLENLVGEGKTYPSLYSGRVSAQLPAFGYVVGKRLPREAVPAK